MKTKYIKLKGKLNHKLYYLKIIFIFYHFADQKKRKRKLKNICIDILKERKNFPISFQ